MHMNSGEVQTGVGVMRRVRRDLLVSKETY
jgi:hypothetical protein